MHVTTYECRESMIEMPALIWSRFMAYCVDPSIPRNDIVYLQHLRVFILYSGRITVLDSGIRSKVLNNDLLRRDPCEVILAIIQNKFHNLSDFSGIDYYLL